MKYFKKNNLTFLTTILLVTLGSFAFGPTAHAGAVDTFILYIGKGLALAIQGLGALFILVMGWLQGVLYYNQYISQPAVINGWKIVLSLCNMFFILILLVIAIATILRRESYGAKQLLGKLLIAAVLINFSKEICGVILDFAQILITSFASVVSPGRLTNLLNIQNYQSLNATLETGKDAQGKAASLENTVLALAFTLIFLFVAFITVLALAGVLLMRIMMIWIYVILSPLAFFLDTFPAGQKYAGQWWSEFTKQVISGPVLAFFIWLAFSIQTSGEGQSLVPTQLANGSENALCTGLTKIMCIGNFMHFITSIAFLFGGLIITQQMGGMAGAIAGKGMAAIKSSGRLARRGITGATWGATKWAAREAVGQGPVTSLAHKKLSMITTEDKNWGKVISDKTSYMKTPKNWGRESRAKEKAADASKMQKRLESMGMGEETLGALTNMFGKSQPRQHAVGAATGAVTGVIGGAVLGSIVPVFGTALGALLGGALGGVTGVVQGPTVARASIKGSKDVKRGRELAKNQNVNTLGTRADGSTPANLDVSGFFSTPIAKHMMNSFKDPANATGLEKVRNDIAASTNKGFVEGWSKLLAGYKSSGADLGVASVLENAVNSNALVTHGTVSTVEEYQKTIQPSYRETGKELKKDRGALSTGQFGSGKTNDISVDFRDLKKALGDKMELNESADGRHIDQSEEKSAVAEALSGLIDKQMSALAKEKSTGFQADGKTKSTLSSQAYGLRIDELQATKDRLSNPKELKRINIINAGIEEKDVNNKFVEEKGKRKTLIHERLHNHTKDEDLVEELTQEIVERRIYSLADDIGAEAVLPKNAGKSFDEILTSIKAKLTQQLTVAQDPIEKEQIANKIKKIDADKSGSRADKVLSNEDEASEAKIQESPEQISVIHEMPEIEELKEAIKELTMASTKSGAMPNIDGMQMAIGNQTKLLANLSWAMGKQFKGVKSALGDQISSMSNSAPSSTQPIVKETVSREIIKEVTSEE